MYGVGRGRCSTDDDNVDQSTLKGQKMKSVLVFLLLREDLHCEDKVSDDETNEPAVMPTTSVCY